jgi:hypothetical protein
MLKEVFSEILDQHKTLAEPWLDPRTAWLEDYSMFSGNDIDWEGSWQKGTHVNLKTYDNQWVVLRYYQRWTKTSVVSYDPVTEGQVVTEGCYCKNFGAVLVTIDPDDMTIEFFGDQTCAPFVVDAPDWADLNDCKKFAEAFINLLPADALVSEVWHKILK